MKVYCPNCNKKRKVVQGLMHLLCDTCSMILYYSYACSNVIKPTEKPKGMEFGKEKK